MRRDGVEPAALVGYLAALGTSHDPRPGLPADLAPGFEIAAVSKSSARFDPRQMLALNRKLLHEMSFAEAHPRLPVGATEHFWTVVRGNLDMMSEARSWWDVAAGHIPPMVLEGEGEFLRAALDTLPPEPFTPMTWPDWTNAVKAATGRKGKALFMPLRQALTGEDHGPDLKDLLPLIGRARAEARLRAAIQA
jgi:glutamyl-tRNA synthetase